MQDEITRQEQLLAQLKAASAELDSADSFVYKSEMLGYLPNLIYHWIEIGGEKLDCELPSGWSKKDFEALVQAGSFEKFEEVFGGTEPEDYWAYYRFIIL